MPCGTLTSLGPPGFPALLYWPPHRMYASLVICLLTYSWLHIACPLPFPAAWQIEAPMSSAFSQTTSFISLLCQKRGWPSGSPLVENPPSNIAEYHRAQRCSWRDSHSPIHFPPKHKVPTFTFRPTYCLSSSINFLAIGHSLTLTWRLALGLVFLPVWSHHFIWHLN